jgi:SAM-dependent methyltransferase
MSIAHKISHFNRERKWKLFNQLLKPTAKTTVLDVGFSDEEYSESDNFLEKHYPYPENLTALGVDVPKKFIERYPKVKAVKYDSGKFPFKDDSFDVCWSNAVIEHVGDRQKQVDFLKETKRVAKTGFITTPNRHFPMEVHTRTPLLHFLPKRIFDKYLGLINKKWATGEYMNLLSLKDLKGLLWEAGIADYKIFKNKFFFFTLDFVIYFRKG